MSLETIGRKGKRATLHIHWQATREGIAGGLAFQTTELIPIDESYNWEQVKHVGRDIFVDRIPPNNDGPQYVQGGRIVNEQGPEVLIFTVK